ncbi:MAG: glycosyltransferase family 39 protein, partial [bacterium]|nr:glycosyltransferase family 39 protein [bacterium]
DSGYYLTYSMQMHHVWDFFTHAVRPPAYSFLINLCMYVTGSPSDAASLLSGITMILSLAVFALILQKFSKDLVLNGLFLVSLFTFSKFVFVFSYAMSESLFSLFVLLTVYYLILHHEGGKPKHYIFAAIFVSLALLTRFMGYSLAAAFLLYTIYYVRINRGKKEVTLIKYLAWNSISYIPTLVFITRNYLLTGTFHGYRNPAAKSIFYATHRTFRLLGLELSFYFLVLLTVSIVLFVLLVRKYNATETKQYIVPMSFMLLFVFIYIALLV